MAYLAADFNYLTILRELEKAVTLRERRAKATGRHNMHRANEVFRNLLQDLAPKIEHQKINLQLKASIQSLLEAEQSAADHLRLLTEGRPKLSRLVAGDWPPIVPPCRIVERFTALTIGLHSEKPDDCLAIHAATAFETAVLPALAWGIVSYLYELPTHLRKEAQETLAKQFAGNKVLTEANILHLNHDELLPFHYLNMVEGWFYLLKKDHPWSLADDVVRKYRTQLAEWLKQPLTDLDTMLWEKLAEHYTGQISGSQRAAVVEKAKAHSTASAGFVRHRLQLFEAAHEPTLRKFRLTTETKLADIKKWHFKAEGQQPDDPMAAAHEACGAAFWLARACFGKNLEGRAYLPNVEVASERTLKLLLSAAVLSLKHHEQLLTCLRYAAGFATNPRYTRSARVLRKQKDLIELYAKASGHRKALVSLFEGRLAWQQCAAKTKPEKALQYYAQALQQYQDPKHGFDAEAPIHFFPELCVLLKQSRKDTKRELKTLEAVDFITQRNYGIYFDIDTEEEMINAGLEQYRESASEADDSGLKEIDDLIRALQKA